MSRERPDPSRVKHPGTLPAPANKRHMSSIDRDAITRALTADVCEAGLSGADLRIWLAVVDRTLTWRWLSDVASHTVLRNISNVARPGRSLQALAGAGLIAYRPGVSAAGQRTELSEITVLVPEGWQKYRDSGVVWRERVESKAEPIHTSAVTVNEIVHSHEAEYGRGDPHPLDEMVHRGMDEMVHLTTREINHERDNRGVVTSVPNAQNACEEENPSPDSDSVKVECKEVSKDLAPRPLPLYVVRAQANGEHEADEEQTPEPRPVIRRVGAATGTQAVVRFAAETGLPLSARTREALAKSLDEVATQVSPHELLMGLGYWHEFRSGRYPQDAAERVGEAMAAESLPIDPCNGMTPLGAIQEGQCRARMAWLPRAEREALEADPLASLQGFGLDWPTPTNVRGLLPAPDPRAANRVGEALTEYAGRADWDKIAVSMARLDAAIQAGAI